MCYNRIPAYTKYFKLALLFPTALEMFTYSSINYYVVFILLVLIYIIVFYNKNFYLSPKYFGLFWILDVCICFIFIVHFVISNLVGLSLKMFFSSKLQEITF